ncbi:collagen alpha-1(III) chain-like [Myotis daubentonii]|uniref:collagen alpha-1(III) chain-like n=1 Tax=Myotis daubentonii TaxID=98922 RepID=UPI002873DDCC|nr:collagen alpha-1(III) chain-like [Myotis daubentonii]
MARGLRIRHPDAPGLRAGPGPAGSGLRGHTCVLNMSGSVRVVCGALPALPGGDGLVEGDSVAGTAAVLPKLSAHGPSERDPMRARLLGLVLSPTSGHRRLCGLQGTAAVCVSWAGVPAPPAAATLALRRPPGLQWLPRRSTGTLSSRGQAVGSPAKLWLEWHSRRSWRASFKNSRWAGPSAPGPLPAASARRARAQETKVAFSPPGLPAGLPAPLAPGSPASGGRGPGHASQERGRTDDGGQRPGHPRARLTGAGTWAWPGQRDPCSAAAAVTSGHDGSRPHSGERAPRSPAPGTNHVARVKLTCPPDHPCLFPQKPAVHSGREPWWGWPGRLITVKHDGRGFAGADPAVRDQPGPAEPGDVAHPKAPQKGGPVTACGRPRCTARPRERKGERNIDRLPPARPAVDGARNLGIALTGRNQRPAAWTTPADRAARTPFAACWPPRPDGA